MFYFTYNYILLIHDLGLKGWDKILILNLFVLFLQPCYFDNISLVILFNRRYFLIFFMAFRYLYIFFSIYINLFFNKSNLIQKGTCWEYFRLSKTSLNVKMKVVVRLFWKLGSHSRDVQLKTKNNVMDV